MDYFGDGSLKIKEIWYDIERRNLLYYWKLLSRCNTWMNLCPFPLADYKDAYPKTQIFWAFGNRKGKKICKTNSVAHWIPPKSKKN